MALANQRLHIAIEEGEEQRANMRAVHVRIGHDDNLAIAGLIQIKIIANTAAKGGNHIANFFAAQNFI